MEVRDGGVDVVDNKGEVTQARAVGLVEAGGAWRCRAQVADQFEPGGARRCGLPQVKYDGQARKRLVYFRDPENNLLELCWYG